MKIIEYNENTSVRLDIALQRYLPNISRSQLRKFIDDGKVTVNQSPQKAGYKVKIGDQIEVDDSESLEYPKIDIPILYEDLDCLVIDKPKGILTHSKGAFNSEQTVASFISQNVQGIEGNRAGIVHRLDRMTSGVMICAKNPEAQKWLQKQFSLRKVKKTYVAIVKSGLQPDHAIIDMPIMRHPTKPKLFRVDTSGRVASTEYQIVEHSKNYAKLILKPETGRTHQIRVHLNQLGYPIVGDTLYGGPPYKRLLLHSHQLELTLPSNQRKAFTSIVPKDFKDIMSQ